MTTPAVAHRPAPEYGNWISKRLVYVPTGIGVVCVVLAAWSLAFIIPAAAFLLVAAYFAYARYLFSPDGADVQGSVWSALLEHLEWDGHGQALDIGCGSAALSIRLAKKYPGAKVTGVDSWGERWEYSKALCERNATIEGVGEHMSFQKASASSLPFPDESFDAVVSNLVFHEVNDTPDKKQLIREALRVVRMGGAFAFQDLFLMKRVYGDIDALLETIRGWGVAKVEFVETRNAPFIPRALKLPFMVGTLGVIVGEK
jgi:SAM-dependent methyltransferase